jgi:protoporphyrinogen/coproporphyrinogen III oxidase
MSVAIVGAGITGLTAAFRLSQKNVPIRIYESSSRAGGVIQTIREYGFQVEHGPNTILETSPRITGFIRELGLESRRLESDPSANKRYVVRGSKPVPLPASLAQFALTPLFSTAAKLRLLAEPFISAADPDEEESIAAFVERRLGREFLDYAINPFVAGVYAGDPRRLSVKQAFPKLYNLEQTYQSLFVGQLLGARARKRREEVSKDRANKFSFDAGLEVMIHALQQRLEPAICFRSCIRRIEQKTQGWAITTEENGILNEHYHEAVLYTAPAYSISGIEIVTREPVNWPRFEQVKYPPVATVALGFRREDVEHPLDGFGMLIPEVEPFHILGTIFSSSLFPNRAPSGHVLLTSFAGGARAPGLTALPHKELVETTLNDLRILLGIRGLPLFQHVWVFPKAIPQYELGYGQFKDLNSQIERIAPGFFLAGNYRDGVSLSDSILSGHDAALRIEPRFENRKPFAPALSS